MRARRVMIIAMAAALSAAPAAAAPWVSAGRWNVYKSETSCAALTFDGETLVGFQLSRSGRSVVNLSEKGWSFEPGKAYDVTLRLDDRPVAATTATGMPRSSDLATISVLVPLLTFDRLGAARALGVYRDGAPLRELSLEGADAAVAQLRRCIAEVIRERPDAVPAPGRRSPAA